MITSGTWIALALLLGIAVGGVLGYRSGLRSEGEEGERRRSERGVTLFNRGIYHLVRDEPDAAIESLIEAAKNTTDLAETYLLLGELYRQRGEAGRAIRLHQSILFRDNIGDELRHQAMLGLAEDYRAAGFFERARNAYSALLPFDGLRPSALEAILELAIKERNWPEALRLVGQMRRLPRNLIKPPLDVVEAYLQVMQGREALKEGRTKEARDWATQAIKRHPGSVAAYLLAGDAEAAEHRLDRAIRRWIEGMRKVPEHASLFLRRLQEREGAEVGDLPSDSPSAGLAMAEQRMEEGRADEALDLLTHLTQRYPDRLELLLALGRCHAALEGEGAGLRFVVSELERRLARQPRYRCHQCGLTLQDVQWRCPRCRSWESMEEIRADLGHPAVPVAAAPAQTHPETETVSSPLPMQPGPTAS